jgi:hypothetical protein
LIQHVLDGVSDEPRIVHERVSIRLLQAAHAVWRRVCTRWVRGVIRDMVRASCRVHARPPRTNRVAMVPNRAALPCSDRDAPASVLVPSSPSDGQPRAESPSCVLGVRWVPGRGSW